MSSTLLGILASAERIGRINSSLTLAQNAEALQYEPEADITTRCIRNEFMTLVRVKYVTHSPVPHDLLLRLTNQCLRPESWTHGAQCSWFIGELNGYHYTALFKPSPGPKLGTVRLTVDDLTHTCQDCS